MGDHRLSVEITLTGRDGKVREIKWFVNWWENKPELLYRELVELAEESGLPVEDKTYLFD